MGSSWYRMGVVWVYFWWGGARARGWKMGTGVERSRCSHPRRTPGLCANLGKRFPPCQGALAARAASQSCSKPSPPCCVDPDKQLALSGKKQIFLLLRRGLSSEF